MPEAFFRIDLGSKGVRLSKNDMNCGRGVSNMIIYKVFCKNYDLREVELVGVLTERRNDLRGKTRLESASRWAKLMFGKLVRDKHAIFIVPDELDLKKNTRVLVEKMVFT